jgi:hypothetical protein
VETIEDHEPSGEEWRQLCSRLSATADQAIALTNDEARKKSIQTNVTRLCRDVPPTRPLLSAWQSLFKEAADCVEMQKATHELLHHLNADGYGAEGLKREADDKIKSTKEEATKAQGETKAGFEKRAAEVKADCDARAGKLSHAWQLTKAALRL